MHVITRVEKGKFAKGVSANPKGRPPIDRELKELLAEHGPKAVQVLVTCMTNKKLRPELRLKAACEVLDRLYGKARQVTDVNVSDNVAGFISAELLAASRMGATEGTSD